MQFPAFCVSQPDIDSSEFRATANGLRIMNKTLTNFRVSRSVCSPRPTVWLTSLALLTPPNSMAYIPCSAHPAQLHGSHPLLISASNAVFYFQPQNMPISFVMSIRPSLPPFVSAPLQLGVFPRNLILVTFYENLSRKFKLGQIGKKCRALYMKTKVLLVLPAT